MRERERERERELILMTGPKQQMRIRKLSQLSIFPSFTAARSHEFYKYKSIYQIIKVTLDLLEFPGTYYHYSHFD